MKIVDSKGRPITPGVTPEQEATANGKAREFSIGLHGSRLILTADQLADLVSPSVRYEQEFKFPDKSAYFFTINGVLAGRKIEGALFAGECILTFAETAMKAKDLATRGIRATVDLLHEEYRTRNERNDSPIAQGINGPDVGGRRAGHGAAMPLPQRKKMEAFVRHIFGGEPWSF